MTSAITVFLDKAETMKHSYIKDFTPRLYQESIFNTCTKHNTMVVLPTGIGKTAIFLMMAAFRILVSISPIVSVIIITHP